MLGRQITPLKSLLMVGIRKFHVLELVLLCQLPDGGHQARPPVLPRESVLWAYQAETVLVCHAWSSIISIVQ